MALRDYLPQRVQDWLADRDAVNRLQQTYDATEQASKDAERRASMPLLSGFERDYRAALEQPTRDLSLLTKAAEAGIADARHEYEATDSLAVGGRDANGKWVDGGLDHEDFWASGGNVPDHIFRAVQEADRLEQIPTVTQEMSEADIAKGRKSFSIYLDDRAHGVNPESAWAFHQQRMETWVPDEPSVTQEQRDTARLASSGKDSGMQHREMDQERNLGLER